METKFKIPYGIGKSGAYEDLPDNRDVPFDLIFSAVSLPVSYDTIDEIGGIKVENQGSSQSCVAQSFSKYAEVLEKIEKNQFTDLSAKFIYSRIFVPQGGAQIRDGAKIVSTFGVTKEEYDPSYPAEETRMRERNNELSVLEDALVHKSSGYVTIWHKEDVEIIKQAIYQNKGVVSGFIGSNEGWQTEIVRPPKSGESEWGHAVYLIGWDNQNRIKFLNSWGEGWGNNGKGTIDPSYWQVGGKTFSLWTLADLPDDWQQQTKMYKLVRNPDNNLEVFAINNGAKRHIANKQTLVLGSQEPDKLWIWQEGQEIPIASAVEFNIPEASEFHLDPID